MIVSELGAAGYTAIGAVVAAAVSGYVTWLIASRTTSGRVDTTEAATLWEEGTTMRRELRDELVNVKAQLSEALAAIAHLNRDIQSSREETERAREETRQSRAETKILMRQIEILHGEVQTHNALTIGALADNTETRRILLVPKSERTPVESEHLTRAGERQPEGERPVIPEADLEEEAVDE